MAIYDKFNIIENHISDDKTKVIINVETFFDNLIETDTKIMIPDYIKQTVWFNHFNEKDLTDSVNTKLNNFLIQRRNAIRIKIKKDNFQVSYINEFIKVFCDKLTNINNITKSNNNTIIKNNILQLSDLIICDNYMMLFLGEQMVSFDESIKNDLFKLFKLINKINKFSENDDLQTYDKLINLLIINFENKIVEIDDVPLSDNLKNIYKLTESLKLYKQFVNYYSFISYTIQKREFSIIKIIFGYLTNIIRNNSLNEIYHVYKYLMDDLRTAIFNYYDIDNKKLTDGEKEQIKEMYSGVYFDIINLIDKSIVNKSYDNIIQLIIVYGYVEFLVLDKSQKQIIQHKMLSVLSPEYIAEIIDYLIQENNEELAKKIATFVREIKNKDLFVQKYCEFFIKRIISSTKNFNLKKIINEYLPMEESIFNIIYKCVEHKLMYKINKIHQDVVKSFLNTCSFYQHHNLPINTIFITTSYNCWDINQSEGVITEDIIENMCVYYDSFLLKQLYDYQKFYGSINNNHVLNWFPHFGEVDITYLEQNIKMLPIHYIVLLMFDDCEMHHLDDIINADFFKNYAVKFRHDIVNSLVISGILKNKNNKIILKTSGEFKNNVIDIFFSISDYATVWEQKRIEEFYHTREEITCANINSIIKKLPTMNEDELFKAASINIDTFELDRETFNKSINYMIKMDYIKKNNDLYEKIYY